MLASGLDGIRRNLVPPPPVEENVFKFDSEQLRSHDIACLPGTLEEALKELEQDQVIAEALGEHTFRRYLQAKGRELLFDGFTQVAGQRLRKDEQLLPPMKEGASLQPKAFAPVQHFTQPPPRYSEASLVKALEKHGIGRPSTYAPIISTIQERGYVRQEMRKLYATELGTLVTEKLVAHFGDILNTGFTSQMETMGKTFVKHM
jgi:DNA topoisomerase IA